MCRVGTKMCRVENETEEMRMETTITITILVVTLVLPVMIILFTLVRSEIGTTVCNWCGREKSDLRYRFRHPVYICKACARKQKFDTAFDAKVRLKARANAEKAMRDM
jgi:hypothetical protein